MAIELGSFKEHSDIIAVLGLLIAAWTSKRTLGKLESNDADLEKAVDELDKKLDSKIKELRKETTELNAELERRSEARAIELHKRIEHVSEERVKDLAYTGREITIRLEHVKEERDKQVAVIEKRLATLEGEHKTCMKIMDRRQRQIPGDYPIKRSSDDENTD